MNKYYEKRKFVEQIETTLKMAMPNVMKVTLLTGEQLNKDCKASHHMPEDDFVYVTMNNGYGYPVNVTGNSLMGILSDVVEKMKFK